MTQKYRTTIRETQNLNSWSVGLGPAFILSATWWTWVCKHWSAILIKALHYNCQFCSRWIITGLVGGHRVSRVLLIVAKSSSCPTRWSEWDNACHCFLLYILICISSINPQGWYLQFRWNVDTTIIETSFLNIKSNSFLSSLIKQDLREMGRPFPVTSLV